MRKTVGSSQLAVGGGARPFDVSPVSRWSCPSRPPTANCQPPTIARLLLCVLILCALPLLAEDVDYREDFQSYKTPDNPAGWVDTSVGTPKPQASGLFKTWDDPLAANNVVYGTKQSSGKPEGKNPRIGTFSTLTTKSFSASGRFEYRGRMLRTNA